MLAADAAEELARRLSGLGLGGFSPRGDQVVRPGAGFDVPLTLVSAGKGRPYEVEQALRKSETIEAPVLFAEAFWPGALDVLERAQANYTDRFRVHIRLQAPEMLVHVVNGEEVVPFATEPAQLDLGGAAGAVAIRLLESPSSKYQVTALANEVHVSPATVQRVFNGLQSEGLVIAHGRGPQKLRHLVDESGSALLDRYGQDARRDRRRSIRLRVLGDTPAEVVTAVARGLAAKHVRYAVTGTAAAALEAPAVTTSVFPVEFWVHGPRSPESVTEAVGGIVSEQGANVIMWRAGSRGPLVATRVAEGVSRASKFRIYADLLADPRRGREQAAYYRENVIGF